MKILIAEDDPISLKILEKNIKGWGFDTLLARDGEEALHRIRNGKVRLAILDWMMPGINGVELCRFIRQESTLHYVYLILLTSKGHQKDIIEGLQSGADDYMTKPVNFLELQARLQTGRRIIDLEGRLLESNQKLKEVASHDSLTSLWNRANILRFLEEDLELGIRENFPISVIMADVDYFKMTNDSYGHVAGDLVLIEVASRLQRSVRKYDKVGRYGGDEMLIVLPNCGLENSRVIADRLRTAVRRRKIRTPSGTIPVSITLGCASTEKLLHPSATKLIHSSDKALYEGKKAGRNCVFCLQ